MAQAFPLDKMSEEQTEEYFDEVIDNLADEFRKNMKFRSDVVEALKKYQHFSLRGSKSIKNCIGFMELTPSFDKNEGVSKNLNRLVGCFIMFAIHRSKKG